MIGITTTDSESSLEIERAISALASEFEQRQLPHALCIRQQIADGSALGEDDALFLTEMLETLDCACALFDQHPTAVALQRGAAFIYNEIMTESFVNVA
ncbi:MAG: hypothetical protein K9L70_00440 [Thiohalocapsa sp.]|nr:hypothetical protein [Thiohalocapsa sp.]MCF7990080.1 hypothetical protein [Thiohalocapsa sp.]